MKQQKYCIFNLSELKRLYVLGYRKVALHIHRNNSN